LDDYFFLHVFIIAKSKNIATLLIHRVYLMVICYNIKNKGRFNKKYMSEELQSVYRMLQWIRIADKSRRENMKKRVCLTCDKETPDTPCPYCGGGKFYIGDWNYKPPTHLPPAYRDYDGNYNIGFCPRCLMEEEKASQNDCFYPDWVKETFIDWAEDHYWDSLIKDNINK